VLTWRDASGYGRLLRGGLIAAVVVGVALLGWSWRHPEAFHDSGGWGVTAPNSKIGETLYVGMSYPRSEDGGYVTLHGGHVNFNSGADNADVELLLCTIDPNAGVGAIGSYRGDSIHEDCSNLVPIHGQRLHLESAGMSQQVVLAVTLTYRGSVDISDITLDYTYGWHRGSQRTGGQVVMSTEEIDT